MRSYFPGGILIALTPAQEGSIPPTPSIHRLRRGLPGYLILFAPHAFAPQRQFSSRKSPSPPVFFLISTHFTATLGIPLSSPILQTSQFPSHTGLSPALLRGTWEAACARFTPNNSGQRLPPTYYRGCWHVVSRGLLCPVPSMQFVLRTLPFRPGSQSFTTRRPSSLTRRCSVRLSPIAEDSPLLPPVGVWTVSQFQCGRSSSQTGY